MRAAVMTRYGGPEVVEIRQLPKPVPKDCEVLVAVHASAVGRSDTGRRNARPRVLARWLYGPLRPGRTILGMEFAGEVEAIGKDVTLFRPGDRVFGMVRYREVGANADYVCVMEDGYIATIPEGLPFEQAVLCEGAFYAQPCVAKLNLKPGDKLLIYGASGAIGTAALQLAKAAGVRVTAVVDTRHLELVKSLGAERAVDYTKEDFTRIGETFDGLLDAVGKTTYLRCRRLLKPEAMFVGTDMGPYGQTLLLTAWRALTGRGRVTVPIPKRDPDFIKFLKACMEAGELRAVIDRRYPLEAIVEAHSYVDTGQKTGIVIIDVR
ncbi:MAG: NAD(P)-dependent alcohol dehydrogenase [Rhizomicrobium sp.]|jgi:NADPH:quinone reductase-like Zn-dependent oxidoreductase